MCCILDDGLGPSSDPTERVGSLAALRLLRDMLASRGRQDLLETTVGEEPMSKILVLQCSPNCSPTKTCSEYLLQDVPRKDERKKMECSIVHTNCPQSSLFVGGFGAQYTVPVRI